MRSTKNVGGYAHIVVATSAFTVIPTSSSGGSTAAAAGGRDQAAAFSTGFLHLYAISTGVNSTTPAGITSLTAPPGFPTLPTSYKTSAYLGSIYFDGVLRKGYQRGAQWTYSSQNIVLASGGTALTSVNTSAYVPPSALSFTVVPYVKRTTSGGAPAVSVAEIFTYGSTALSTDYIHRMGVAGAGILTVSSGGAGNVVVTVPQSTAQGFMYSMFATGNELTANYDVMGYRVANGDA
jgi:hypothetical protein